MSDATADDPSAGVTLVVLLAAGGGSRFDGPTHKLLADLDGEPVAVRAIRDAIDAAIGPVVVVTGAADLDEILDTIDRREGQDLDIVRHPGWADGQASSLQVGVAEAERRGASAIVVGLADQPFVGPEAWRRVAASPAAIAVATYDGHRRNPVRLDRSVWSLLPTSGDHGARFVIRLRPELVEEVPCPGSAADIDTQEDLASWQNRSSTNSP